MTSIKLLILLSYLREILITNRGGCLKKLGFFLMYVVRIAYMVDVCPEGSLSHIRPYPISSVLMIQA